jgi:transcriptional antiterminator Rof (Rho-off)
MKKYEPINCSLYDHFEIHAMRKELVIIQLEGQNVELVIKTLEAREDGEYLIPVSGEPIRLDLVKSIRKKDV